jgi:hypothetical protein
VAVGSGLASSLICLLLAPLPRPPDYSWISHTTSEAAAQGLQGAWLARLGSVLFGLAVIWLAMSAGRRWGRWGQTRSRVFDVLAVAASIVIPISMGVWPEYAGVLQRLMFLIAYVWYASEALGGERVPQISQRTS